MTKYCSGCNNTYPATLEYFYKNSSMKDGLSNYCKNCYKKYKYRYYGKRSNYMKKDNSLVLINGAKYLNGRNSY